MVTCLPPASFASDASPDAHRTAAYLLVQLRRAHRRIARLRGVAAAAIGGRAEDVQAAVAALRPGDLSDVQRRARRR